MRFDFIRTHASEYPVMRMCQVLGVSKAGYYVWRKRAPSVRERSDLRLKLEIRTIHRASKRRYGSPRVHDELRDQGIRCGKNRVARLMREDGLRAKKTRRFRVTTNSNHVHAVAPNLLNRRFAVGEIEGVNQVWASDITYVPTRQGWLYLAVVLDLKSRAVVGWAMRDTLDTSLATDALMMALWRRRPGRGLIHHSDRGVQYASGEYQALLYEHRITCSMSRKGNAYDNAVAESFFATLEWELIEDSDWQTHAEAKRAIFDYLEVWYNRQRRHSSLGFMSPAAYEAQLALTPRAA